MALILLILKILGITVLSVFALFLFFLLCALFVPFKYRLSGEKTKDSLSFRASVIWIPLILRGFFSYTSEAKASFGIKLLFFDFKKLLSDDKKIAKKSTPKKKRKSKVKAKSDKHDGNLRLGADNSETEEETDAGSKLIYTFMSVYGKIKKIYVKISNLKDVLSGDEFKTLIGNILNYLSILVKDIKPRSIDGCLNVGTGSPDTISYLFGLYALLFSVKCNRLIIIPEYKEAVFEGNAVIKGHMTGAVLIRILIKFLKNKDLDHVSDILQKLDLSEDNDNGHETRIQ